MPALFIVRFNDYHKRIMELLEVSDAVEARNLRPWCMRYYARGYSKAACANMLKVMMQVRELGKPKEVTPSEPPL